MKKQIKIALPFILLLFAVAACNQNAQYYDWEERYRENGTFPYDMMVLNQLFDGRTEELKVLRNDFKQQLSIADSSNFLHIGNTVSFDSSKLAVLKEYVYTGNKAFIISNKTPYPIFYSIYNYPELSNYSVPSEKVIIGFENDVSFTFEHIFNHEPASYNWPRFSIGDSLANDSAGAPITLSTVNDSSTNFIKVKYGNGAFYFHCNPILFSNYHLKTDKGFAHAQKVFSHLNSGTVFWDKSYLYIQQEDYKSSDGKKGSAIKLLFSHPSLKWAWFSLLVSIILFVLFRSKREQRIIPIMSVNSNDSLEFAKNVGNLYFKNGNHKHIALEMYETFLADARNHYNIDTNQEPAQIFKLIEKRSGLGEEKINELSEFFKLRFSELGNRKELIKLYHSLNYYYNYRK